MRSLPLAALLASGCAGGLAYVPNPPAPRQGFLPATAVLPFQDATADFDLKEYGGGSFLVNMARREDKRAVRLPPGELAALLVRDFRHTGAFASIRYAAPSGPGEEEVLLIEGRVKQALFHRRMEGGLPEDELVLALAVKATYRPEGRVILEKTFRHGRKGRWRLPPKAQAAELLRLLLDEVLRDLALAARIGRVALENREPAPVPRDPNDRLRLK